MSYSLFLSNPPQRTTTEILSALDGARCCENPDGLPDGAWPAGILHFFQPGISTRGVELVYEKDKLQLRLASLACPEDWTLAYRFLTAFAGDPERPVTGEDGTSGACKELEARFNEVMIRETAAGMLAVDGALTQPGAQLRMPGPIRDVVMGPRLMGELPSDAAGRLRALFECIRRVQFLEGHRFCEPMPLSIPGVPSFAVWTPTEAQAFSAVEALGLSAPEGNLYVPIPSLPALLGERFRWLDEAQFAISATPAAELPALIERARAATIDPYQRVRKKWWQFWRSE